MSLAGALAAGCALPRSRRRTAGISWSWRRHQAGVGEHTHRAWPAAAGTLLVFPQASAVADTGPDLATEFRALGLGRVVVIAADHAGADTEAVLQQTAGATGVYFAGGDQNRLMAVLRGTKLETRLRALYRDGAVIAGTSAGAAVLSRVMITGDEQRPLTKDQDWQTIEADNVVTAPGLGLLDDVVVDQHFVRRRRHNPLISLVLEQPALLGVAIDEETPLGEAGPHLRSGRQRARARLRCERCDHGARTPPAPACAGRTCASVLRAGAVYDLRSRTVQRNAPTP
jgi:cyanophycinase